MTEFVGIWLLAANVFVVTVSTGQELEMGRIDLALVFISKIKKISMYINQHCCATDQLLLASDYDYDFYRFSLPKIYTNESKKLVPQMTRLILTIAKCKREKNSFEHRLTYWQSIKCSLLLKKQKKHSL